MKVKILAILAVVIGVIIACSCNSREEFVAEGILYAVSQPIVQSIGQELGKPVGEAVGKPVGEAIKEPVKRVISEGPSSTMIIVGAVLVIAIIMMLW